MCRLSWNLEASTPWNPQGLSRPVMGLLNLLLLFLSKQTSHERNIVSFYFFLFIRVRTKCLSREQCVGSPAALCSSCSLQKYLEGWPAALNEAGWSVLMNGHKTPRIELNAFHFCQPYSLFMRNKLQDTWRGDYCERVRPAQLPVLTCSSSSVPPGTTYTIRSPPGPRRVQQPNSIAFILESGTLDCTWDGTGRVQLL